MWSPKIIPEIGRFQWGNNWSWGTPIIPEIPRKPSPRPGPMMILQDPQRFSSEFLRSIETFCSLEAAEFKAQTG